MDGEVRATYTHDDRLVVGGVVPGAGQLDLPAWTEVLGTESHLAGRELGIINVGGAGHVLVDGDKFELEHLDGLFVGRGSDVAFAGAEAAFYFVSAPAHATYPSQLLSHSEVEPVALGSSDAANERSLFRCGGGPVTGSTSSSPFDLQGRCAVVTGPVTTEFDNPVRTVTFEVP